MRNPAAGAAERDVRDDLGLPTSEPETIDRAQVIVAYVPARDWAGLEEWSAATAETRQEHSRHGTRIMAIRHFDHSSQQPLVALLLREGSLDIAFVAAAHRGRYHAAAGLSQLILYEATPIPQSSEIKRLVQLQRRVGEANPRTRRYFNDALVKHGGLLPPTTSKTIVSILREHHRTSIARLGTNFPKEADSLAAVDARRRFVFQQQRDAALLAFSIVGLKDLEPLNLKKSADLEHSFLDQLPQTRLSEEQVLRADALTFPEMIPIENVNFDRRTFVSGNRRLDLIFAHREELEEITGADFIYYNATFESFVLVQYKLLEKDRGREIYRINDHMHGQMNAMRAQVPLPSPIPNPIEPKEYRLGHEACFWKFVSRKANLETDQSLIQGHYVPLSLLQKSIQRGPKGGKFLEPGKLPRTLSNTGFAVLVRDAWAGSASTQTRTLRQLIENTLSDRRAVTLAIHTSDNSTDHS